MSFSYPVAVAITLLSAAMWGSWMQVIKRRGTYPIEGIAFWMFPFSFVMTGAITLLLSIWFLPEGILVASREHAAVIPEILLGGAMLSCGVYFGLAGMGKLGMLRVTTLSGTMTCILGVVTSIAKEGLPSHPWALPLVLISSATLILASVLCAVSFQMCERDRLVQSESKPAGERQRGGITLSMLACILLYAVLSNGWSMGTATGATDGMPALLIGFYMAAGSALGILLLCGIVFTRRNMWKTVLCVHAEKKPLLLGLLAAVGYYGGNLLSIYTMSVLSVTLSFLFGRSYSIWTYLWSFYYGEYRGARRKTILVLSGGLLLYLCAIGLLFLYNVCTA